MSAARSRLRFFVFSLVPAAALLLVLEAGSYLYYRYKMARDFMAIDISDSFDNIPDLFERRHTPTGDILFSRYFPTRYYVSDQNYRGKIMAVVKTPKIFRIFSFGGSSTAGSPWGHEASFSRFLEDELNALKRQGTTVEVINFGGSGYGSTRALGLVKAAIQYQPDLIIIYAGHNEMWDNYVYLDLARDGVKAGLRRFGDRLYTVRVARKLLEQKLAKPPERVNLLTENSMFIPPLLKENKGFKAPERGYLATQFRQNMLSIIQTARARHVPVLLVSEPSHFFYLPSWYPGEGEQEQARLVSEMRAAHERHDLGLARLRANEILRLNTQNPQAHFYLGLMDKVAGDYKDAREHFLAAIDFDEKPERYTRAYRSIQQSLENPAVGVYFVDAWKVVGDFLDDGLLDGRLFVDKMHPIVECNKLIARTIENDYFAQYLVRDDLFDYSRIDPERIWRDNLSPDFYLMICARYFNIADPALCVPEMYHRYMAMTDGTSEKGIYRITWEYLLYYGLLTHDPDWLKKSENIYQAHSLEAVRATALRP